MEIQLQTRLPPHRELYLNLYFSLKKATNWAEAGHTVATGQLCLAPPKSITRILETYGSSSMLRERPLESAPNSMPALTVFQATPTTLEITAWATSTHSCPLTTWTFDLVQGQLTSWRRYDQSNNNGDNSTRQRHEHEVLHDPLTFAIYRALTNNDAGGDDPIGRPGSQGRQWRDARVHLAKNHNKTPPPTQDSQAPQWEHTRSADGAEAVTIHVPSRIAPPVLGWGIDMTTTYRFLAGGDDDCPPAVHVHVRAAASGPWTPPNIPRFGLVLGLSGTCASARWFGRGPGESYRDKKDSQLMGTYTSRLNASREDVGERGDGGLLFTDYEVPQENGNRTDLRWVEFYDTDDDGDAGTQPGLSESRGGRRLLRARFGNLDGASFSASKYTALELDVARHPHELRSLARDRVDRTGQETVWVHLDWVHHGLGTGSCGPETLPRYSLDQKEFEFELVLD